MSTRFSPVLSEWGDTVQSLLACLSAEKVWGRELVRRGEPLEALTRLDFFPCQNMRYLWVGTIEHSQRGLLTHSQNYLTSRVW